MNASWRDSLPHPKRRQQWWVGLPLCAWPPSKIHLPPSLAWSWGNQILSPRPSESPTTGSVVTAHNVPSAA